MLWSSSPPRRRQLQVNLKEIGENLAGIFLYRCDRHTRSTCLLARQRDSGRFNLSKLAHAHYQRGEEESDRADTGFHPRGGKIYLKHCATCHGKNGDGDRPRVVDLGVQPSRLCDLHLRADPDGALFWKITTGKKPMPGYGMRYSEIDRWNLINYIRTLAGRQ